MGEGAGAGGAEQILCKSDTWRRRGKKGCMGSVNCHPEREFWPGLWGVFKELVVESCVSQKWLLFLHYLVSTACSVVGWEKLWGNMVLGPEDSSRGCRISLKQMIWVACFHGHTASKNIFCVYSPMDIIWWESYWEAVNKVKVPMTWILT